MSTLTDLPSNNRKSRLIKNSVYLYGRSIIQMMVSLFTVRLSLKYLGVDNYGLYNLLSAIVVACSFVNASLQSASNRYITYAVGSNDSNYLASVFKYACKIQRYLIIALFIGFEIIGNLLIIYKLSIPEGMLGASIIVYQIAIISFIINVFLAPYKSILTAYERFDVISTATILDSVLKLAVVLVLPLFKINILVFYAVLMCIAHVAPLLYQLISAKKYTNFLTDKIENNGFLQRMEYLGFASWNMFGAIGQISMNQGYNLLINLFFGVAYNAAHALAFQINGYVIAFTSAFTMALQPQVVKSFSANDMSYYNKILMSGCKMAFLLIMIISMPLIFEVEYILGIWLGEYPVYTPVLVKLILINVMINNIAAPLSYAIEASGKIKMMQVINGSLMFLSIFVVYLFYRIGFDCNVAYVIMIIVTSVAQFARLYYSSKYSRFSIKGYLKYAFSPIVCSIAVEFLFLLLITNFIDSSFVRVIFCCTLPLLFVAPLNLLMARKYEMGLVKDLLAKIKKY